MYPLLRFLAFHYEVKLSFFAQSVRIKLASPQAKLLSIFLKENQKYSPTVRDLNKGRTTETNDK